MADHAEEQEMEAEALAAIFDMHFTIQPAPKSDAYTQSWTVDIYPEQSGADEEELDQLNHVAVALHVHLPPTYPDGGDEGTLPDLDLSLLKGLSEDPHKAEILQVAREEAETNLGVPSVFAVVEAVRAWLLEHNRPGLDDMSMHAQMMMRQQKKAPSANTENAVIFEAQTIGGSGGGGGENFTEAELEEIAVRKRRQEGTPCNKENFLAWRQAFEEEQLQIQQEKEAAAAEGGKGAAKESDKSDRMTGFQFFRSKASNLDALEAAAEAAAEEQEEEEEEEEPDSNETQEEDGINAELFDEDVDLDDLDFDDDDEDDEVDI